MKAKIDSVIEMGRQERNEMKQLIQHLLEEKKQYTPNNPLLEIHLSSISMVKDHIPPSGKAWCLIMYGSTNTSKLDVNSHTTNSYHYFKVLY